MKTHLKVIIFFILISQMVSGQEKPVKLNLKEGYRYVFEKLDYGFHLTKAGTRDTISMEKKVIQCDVEKVLPGEKIILKVSLKENVIKNSFPKGPSLDLNYFFPEYTPSSTFNNYFEELLCRVNLKYALNLKTRKAELLNKAELFDRFREIMIQKGNDTLFAETTLNLIDQENKLVNAGLVSYLLWFQDARITPDGQILNSLLPGKPALWNALDENVRFSKNELLKLKDEGSLVKCSLDTLAGILTNFLKFSRVIPKFPNPVDQLFSRNVMENGSRINLLSSGRIPPDLVFMTGKIEKPLSKKLYISYLQKPFGDEMQKRTIFLDENGSFSSDFACPHGGFLYVENDNPNKYNPPATFVFYAEPGDSIRFEANGQKMPWTVTFSGDRVNENQLLSELRKQIRIKDKFIRISSPGGELLDGEIMYSFNADFRNMRVTTGEGVQQLITHLGKAKEIILKHKSLLSDPSFDFISKEVNSYFYSALYRYLWTLDSYIFRMGITQRDEANHRQVLKYVENIDIQSVYNDYGVQSRRIASNYLTYNFNWNNKNRNYRVNYGYRFSYHADILIPYARMILSGSSLYREIGFILTGQYGYIPLNASRNDSAIHRELINRNFDLMLKTCNDNEFLDEITRLKNHLLKSKAKKFVPEVSFFNTRGELVRFSHYFGSKPSVFHIARNWVGDRYTLDAKTKENPDLNFVMVMEGNNFREWTEYQKSAEPVADQLLLKNDTTSLRDLFIRNYDFFIVYDKQGNLVGYENKLDRAITMAQKSLILPKMPVNPAKLWLIIGILMGILVVFLMVGLGWRWKARRQLIKEQQQRHLRELELTAIRSQMNPHFLFNSLNSVQNLIRQNRSLEANQYLADFAGLIRKVLKNSEKEEVPLAEELEMVRQYLNLEKLRFDFHFEISVDPDVDQQNTLIPSMLLQPVAENAVIHGLHYKSGKKELRIEIANSEEGLILSVEDNGIGREAARSFSTGKNGKGLKLIEERLKILKQKLGEDYRLEIIDLNEDGLTGTRVEIVIPEEK